LLVEKHISYTLLHRQVSFQPFASFRSPAEFCRYPGIADSGEPSARQIYEFAA